MTHEKGPAHSPTVMSPLAEASPEASSAASSGAAGADSALLVSSVSSVSSEPTSSGDGRLLAGRYELIGLLGAGGMGTVYRARDRALDEIVALKVLRRELVAAEGMLERFRREVKLARRVTHRNVARSYDIGEHEGERFLTMELIEGEPLSALIARGGPLELPALRRVGAGVCEGLAAAHEAGVAHRDLKPDNVMLTGNDRVVITDFGIARALAQAPSAARSIGGAVGTPAYMAPEQVDGASPVDARADIYSLGVMLFEMLTGALPFEGTSPYAVAAARLLGPPPDPRARRPGLSELAAGVVLRAMARSPAQRFQTATEVAVALAALGPDDVPPLEPAARARAPGAAEPHAPTEVLALRGAEAALEPVTGHGAKAVAVLPFRNAGRPDDAYLAEGLTEDLTDALSTVPQLRVRPRGMVMHSAGKQPEANARALGAQLAVQVVVDGSVRKEGDRVRVSARLISVADGFQLWARRFDRPVAEVLVVSDEVASAIAAALTVEHAQQQRRQPTDPRALEAYLRGRAAYHRFERGSVTRGAELLAGACSLAPQDPTIAAAHALALARVWFYEGGSAGEAAREAADRALALDPEGAEPRVASAYVSFLEGDVPRAVREASAALAAAPLLPDAHELLGRILSETGPADVAMRHYRATRRLDPAFQHAYLGEARIHALDGRWDDAEEILDAATALPDPDAAWALRARFAAWRNDQAALAALRAHPGVTSGTLPVTRRIVEFMAGAEAGQPAAFWSTVDAAPQGTWRTRSLLAQTLVELALSRGRRADVLSALEAASAAGLIDLLWLDGCPAFDPFRAEPAFAAVRAVVEQRSLAIRACLA
jgi:eukaryotic-like serine/threonine-protein kinase